MQQVKLAMELTTCHGLPRMVTNKSAYLRVTWLLFFILMFCLFGKGFYEFAVKLQSRKVTTSLNANSVKFRFPDIYACFDNPVAASYSATLDKTSADLINSTLDSVELSIIRELSRRYNLSDESSRELGNFFSFIYPQSLSYSVLVSVLSHRIEQSVIDSYAVYKDKRASPSQEIINPEMHYNPLYLSCIKWKISDDTQDLMLQSRSSAGLFVSLLMDVDFVNKSAGLDNSVRQIYYNTNPIQLPQWSMYNADLFTSDRRSGVRVFLTPSGEYPSDFVTSFSLGPGKHHTVEMSMTKQVLKDDQFSCLSDQPDVQFVNPYDQTAYNHSYSYSYCYYYEYHSRYQAASNTSGDISPLPWPLRNQSYALNLSAGAQSFFSSAYEQLSLIGDEVLAACENKRLCSTYDYRVSISSADWPTESSVKPFISHSVKEKWQAAKSANLSVPALDYLMAADDRSAASYLQNNMLKVYFKPQKLMCDEVTFSIDYELQNFISDIGGIMGIYLGMSLLTLCELLELAYDLLAGLKSKIKTSPNPESNVKSAA